MLNWKLPGLSSKEINLMDLKKLLTTEIPTISKSTSYRGSLKACSLLFILAEAFLAVALQFNYVTSTEFWQITLGLFVLWPITPLILRMKNDKSFFIITGSVLIAIVALLATMKVCDQYYVKSVFGGYLQGEDYQRKSGSLSKFASSNAIAYTQFLIDECVFLRQSVLEAKQLKEKSEHGLEEDFSELRNRIMERMCGLNERFAATGYSNKSSEVGLESLRGKYGQLLKSIPGNSFKNH